MTVGPDAGTPVSMNENNIRYSWLRRGWLRLLDGEAPWGAMDIRPERFGTTRYILLVYPPGISDGERRRVRVWRGWPQWGTPLLIVSAICLSQIMNPILALIVSVAAFLGTGFATFKMAGLPPAQVRTMGVTSWAGYHDPVSTELCHQLRALAATLMDADEQRRRGQMTSVEFESVWWRVYDQMAPVRAETPGFNGSESGTR
jgi:hypothetical protein